MADPNDPWAKYRQPQAAPANGLPTAPLPFPAQGNPVVQQRIGRTAQQSALDNNQDARAADANAREAERLRMAREQFEAEKRRLDANGGADVTVEENKSTGLTSKMIDLTGEIIKLQKENPDAINPGLMETMADWTGNDFVRKAVTSKDTRDVRTNLNNLYRDLVQTAIYQASGAAFQEAELQGLLKAYQPDYFDTPTTRASKMRQIGFAIKAGILKNGAGNLKLAPEQLKLAADLAEKNFLDSIEKADNQLSGKQAGNVTNAASGVKLSDQRDSITIPPEYQKAYEVFLATKKPGELTVDEYVRVRQALDKAYLGEEYQGNPYSDAQKFVDAFNRGEPVTATIPEPTRELGAVEGLLASAASSKLGVAAVNFANAGSGGIPELLTGAQGRKALEAANAEEPEAALFGDVAGSVAPGMLLEKLGTKAASRFLAGPTGQRFAGELLGNAAYGAARGFNSAEEGEGLSGAAAEGGMGVVGSLAGRAAVRGAKGFMPGNKAAAIEKFLNPPEVVGPNGELIPIPGVDLTTPQRMGLTNAEEAVQGLPFIHGQREKTIGSFNTQNAARVLGNVGIKLPKDLEPGQATNDFVNQKLNEVYNTLKPKIKGNIPAKDPFNNAFAAIRAKALQSGSPERAALWKDIEGAVAQFKKGGKFDGNDFREASSRLLEIANVNSKNGDDLAKLDIARAAEKVRTQLIALVNRTDPQVAKELKAVSKSWAMMKRIEGASTTAGSMANRGVYPPDDLLGSIKRLDTSTDKGMVARGKGLDQPYAQDAREVVGSRAAKSSSLSATSIAGYVLGPVLAIPGAAAYAPGIKRLTQAMVDGRLGSTADAIGAKISKDPKYSKIPADILQAAITQYIRAKSAEAAKE